MRRCMQTADSTFMAANVRTPPLAMHPTVEQGFLPDLHPSRKAQGNLSGGGDELQSTGYSYAKGSAFASQPARGDRLPGRMSPEEAAHHTQRSGFLGELPPTAARQRALAVETATPKRRAVPSEELEEPLVGALISLSGYT